MDNSALISGDGVARDISQADIDSLKAAILLLERMDDLLLAMGREALQMHSQDLPIIEAQLDGLRDNRDVYQATQFDAGDMRRYLVSLPDYETIWVNVNRSIIRYFTATAESRHDEWMLWLAGIEKAGTITWQKAVNAGRITGTAAMNAFIRRLRFTDDLLNTLHRTLLGPEAENRLQFSTELDDTMQVLSLMALTQK
jgi:hypothetical protein